MAVVKLNKDNIDAQIKKDIQGSQPTQTTKMKQITTGTSRDNKKKNIVSEILEPIVTRSISDIVVQGLAMVSDIIIGVVDMKLYGENRHKSSSTFIGRNYNSLYRSNTILSQPLRGNLSNQNLSSLYHNPSNGFRLQEVVVPTRGDAELVIDALCEKIDIFGIATVGDYYDAVGIKTSAIDFKYGWVNLSSASKHRTFDGYAIILPTPKPLD